MVDVSCNVRLLVHLERYIYSFWPIVMYGLWRRQQHPRIHPSGYFAFFCGRSRRTHSAATYTGTHEGAQRRCRTSASGRSAIGASAPRTVAYASAAEPRKRGRCAPSTPRRSKLKCGPTAGAPEGGGRRFCRRGPLHRQWFLYPADGMFTAESRRVCFRCSICRQVRATGANPPIFKVGAHKGSQRHSILVAVNFWLCIIEETCKYFTRGIIQSIVNILTLRDAGGMRGSGERFGFLVVSVSPGRFVFMTTATFTVHLWILHPCPTGPP